MRDAARAEGDDGGHYRDRGTQVSHQCRLPACSVVEGLIPRDRREWIESGPAHGDPMTNNPVTVIGLGAMGTALAETLLANDHPVTVWNRSPEKADALVEKGATRADSVAAAVAASELVIACVLDYAALRSVLDPVAEKLRGRVLVNLTTGTPEQARSMASWATEHGIDYVDGAITAIPPMIGLPESLLLYGGSERAFDQWSSTLELFGSAKFFGADPGLPLVYDLALLGLMYEVFSGYLHAVALVTAAGQDAVSLNPLAGGWLNAVLTWLPEFAENTDSGHHPDTGSSLAMQARGMRHMVEARVAAGVNADAPAYMESLMEQAVAEGHGADGTSRLIDIIRKRG
ncbi:NAD(P)-dependent oxidoreductase [Allokutzneria oryzae]|uniref:NAD(P)-dependent oxidoreductase n=1 Tax=Allokutzneria oryzae TaxID=1378989 RepID=A0ABV6AA58_9PSEU